MKKTVTILLVTLLACSASAEFSKVGSAGAQFLKIGLGSRYQGMGEAAVATVNDAYAMYWNPAGLVEIDNKEISFTKVNWLLDIDMNFVGFAKQFEDVGVFGVSVAVLSMGDQEITTFAEQNGTGDFYSAYSYVIGLSFARQLTDRFAFGITGKYVGEKIHTLGAQTFAFDFGTMLYTGFRSLRMGMSITNMGPEAKFSGPDLNIGWDGRLDNNGNNPDVAAQIKTTPYDLPMTFRVGAAYDVEMGPKGMVTVAGELKHPNDNLQQGALGAEWGWDERFFLRGGYKINYDEEGLTFGVGLQTTVSNSTNLIIDYAWQDLGRLKNAQRFSVGFTF